MKMFGLEIKKAEKEVKPMTCEEVDLAADGVCPDDTTEPKKTKKGLGKKILLGVGTVGAVAGAVITVLAKNGDTGSDVEAGDLAESDAPFTEAAADDAE